VKNNFLKFFSGELLFDKKIEKMLFRHIVWFDFSACKLSDKILAREFAALSGIVTNYGFGRTITKRSKDFTHCLTVDIKDLDLYSNDKVHLDLVERVIKPNLGSQGIMAMDFELE
jgi:hypothetical protein